ncbi:uncharacterized protein P174DRAFT_444360, partial [Aspergillus novofumigatus IBT 16806]
MASAKLEAIKYSTLQIQFLVIYSELSPSLPDFDSHVLKNKLALQPPAAKSDAFISLKVKNKISASHPNHPLLVFSP